MLTHDWSAGVSLGPASLQDRPHQKWHSGVGGEMHDDLASDSAPDPTPLAIEVGASDDTLRYWLAKEALRQGEVQMAAQSAALQSLASRATSILGWSVTITGALAAAAVSGPYRVPA